MLTRALRWDRLAGWLGVRRIDVYVLVEVIGPLLGGILFFTFVFLMFQLLRLAEFFIVHNIPAVIIGKMILLMILSFLPITLPVAFLIAVLVAFGRLSADSELVAMKSSGISVPRLAIPIVGLALATAVISLFLNMEWVPWGEKRFRSLHIKVGNTKVASAIQEGTFTTGFFDLLIYADKVDSKANTLKKVFIFDERDERNPVAVVAQAGEIIPLKAASELGSETVLKLDSGNIHRNEVESETYQKIDFNEYYLYLKIREGEDAGDIKKPKMQSYEDLVEKLDKFPDDSLDYREYVTELWRRVAVAFSPVIFVFLGIGYGTIQTRSVRSGAALVAILVLIAYWAIQAFATGLAHSGWLPAFVAMQLPNLVTAVAAVHGFRKAAW